MEKKNYLYLRIKTFLGKLNNYRIIILWLALDSVWRFKGMATLTILSGLLGVSIQVSVIGLAFHYAQALEKGQPISILNQKIELQYSIILLLVVTSIFLFLLLVSSGLIYFNRSRNLKLGLRYEIFCSKRVFSLLACSPRLWSPPGEDFCGHSLIIKLISSDARYCGVALRILMNTFIPGITFIAYTVYLFYINITLTFLIIFLIIISFIFLYRETVRGISKSRLMEKHAKKAASENRRMIRRIRGMALSLGNYTSWLDEHFERTIQPRINAYEGRLIAIEKNSLIISITGAISLFSIFVFLGGNAIYQGKGWGILIIYLFALQLAISNLQKLIVLVTSINRFYPQISRYYLFVKNTSNRKAEVSNLRVEYSLAVVTNYFPNSLKNLVITKGNRIGLIIPLELDRYTLSFIVDSLLGHSQNYTESALYSMWFGTSKYECFPKQSLKGSLNLPTHYSWEELHRDIKKSGMWEQFREQLPHNLEKPVQSEIWKQLDPGLKFALALVAALHSNSQWILIEETDLQSLTPHAQEYFLQRFSDRIVVIVFNKKLKSVGKYGEDVIAVIHSNNLIGLGSVEWFTENKDQVSDSLDQALNQADKSSEGKDIDDDFEEDEE